MPRSRATSKGKLLLMHGEMDDNVHPSLTMQLADALIAANKDFDLLIIPFTNHGFFDSAGGWQRRTAISRSVTPTSSASDGITS